MDAEKPSTDAATSASTIASQAKADAPPKRDANAARELPGLYVALASARELLNRATSPKAAINPHTVHLTLDGDDVQHKIGNKEAFGKAVIADLTDLEASISAKIKALGFEPH